VIASTNRDLSRLVKKQRFRQDLYYRVRVVRIRLPALRERREDIPLLAQHFVARFNRLQSRDIAGVSDEVMARLMEYEFPGNVRELENIIEHAFVLCPGGLIEIKHLPPELRGREAAREVPGTGGTTLKAMERVLIADAVRRHEGNRSAAARELDIDPSTLFRKVKALGIALPEKDGRSRRG
jgi:DNA-binding NtrC family response regulator